MNPIVSIHLPKTAGTSFYRALTDCFGSALLFDDSEGLSKDLYERRRAALMASLSIGELGLGEFRCVHGHFLAVKYLLLSSRQPLHFVTWLRNPVDRAVSHYHYWKSHYDPAKAIPIHHKMINEDWSLQKFCSHPRFRNLYQQYLWSFPLHNFDFIGITEHYNDDLKYFGNNFLGEDLTEYHLNIRNVIGGEDNITAGQRREIEAYHADDMALYEFALSLREGR